MNRDMLEAALIGYQAQIERIQGAIRDIQKQLLGGGGSSWGTKTLSESAAPRKKRTMSAAARKRIAAAQNRRWAEYHAAKGE